MTKWDFVWHGWDRWVFGITFYPQNGIAWINRWVLALGPCDLCRLCYARRCP